MVYEAGKKLLKSNWLKEEGPDEDIVISSRVRLARNIERLPFPSRFDSKQGEEVIAMVNEVVEKSKDTALNFNISKNRDIPTTEREILVEKHLISPQHANAVNFGATIVNQDESLCIMVNEEDHLRIQTLVPGLSLNKSWEYANYIDDLFEETIDYAFSEEKGYLTSCPTNTGTGLRASVMIHLPGLVMTNQISIILTTLSQLGLTVRGLYGEGTHVGGDLFQVSNQITLGQSEEEIINNLSSVIMQIKNKERVAREKIYRENIYRISDQVFRSLGTLKYARIISSNEALKLISNLRLGVSLGIIDKLSLNILKEMMVLTRPAILRQLYQDTVESTPIATLRADLSREVFQDIN